MFPDLEYLGQKIIIQKGKNELRNLLKKVLNTEQIRIERPGSEEGQTDGNSPQTIESPEKIIIDNILDKIFN